MAKWAIMAVLTLIIAFSPISTLEAGPGPTRTYTARITAANLRSKINCQGKSLRGLLKKYGNICAVEQKTLPLYTKIIIAGESYTIVDVIPRKSTRKHHRRAKGKGITLDLCLDIYKDVPRKQLYQHDKNITEIKIIK